MARYDGQPMTLANMRSLGVTSVEARCGCGREESVDAGALPDDLPVPDVRLRLVCAACGGRPFETRPDWREYSGSGMGRR